MKIRKYDSIDNSYITKTIDFIHSLGMSDDDVEWVATEKVHGSNLQIQCDGNDVLFASRWKELHTAEEMSQFGSLHVIKDELTRKVLEVSSLLEYHKPVSIIVYGEICGGSYPHEDVVKNSNVRKAQKIIYYSPNVEFFVFDIFIMTGGTQYNTREARQVRSGYFIDQIVLNSVCRRSGLMSVPLLWQGTFNACMEYRNDGTTWIPHMLGLPPIEDNIMEGTVVKPMIHTLFNNDARIIIKNKNVQFSEKLHALKTHKPAVVRSKGFDTALNAVVCRTNVNRLDAVLSKRGGEFEMHQISGVIKLMSTDIMEEIVREEPETMQGVPKDEKQAFNKLLFSTVGKFLAAQFRK